MDLDTSLGILTIIAGAMAIIILGVSFFYRPGKKLKVDASYLPEGSCDKCVEFHIVNIGRKRIKMATPFVKFYSHQTVLLFEIKRNYTNCKFPKIIGVGEEMRCQFDVAHFYEVLDNKKFHPLHFKIVIRDTVGMKFISNTLDYKH